MTFGKNQIEILMMVMMKIVMKMVKMIMMIKHLMLLFVQEVILLLYLHIDNHREDFQWKLAGELAERYDVLCFEDLNMKGMQMMWGRKVSDLAFASFLNKVEYLQWLVI